MSDLKSGGAEIVRQAQETGRPVVLTRHGRGVAVVLSVDAYDQLVSTSQVPNLRAALADADASIAAGRYADHDEVARRMRARMKRDAV